MRRMLVIWLPMWKWMSHSLAFEQIERFEQLAAVQSELARVAAALLPLAATGGGELDADAEIGADVELLGHAGDCLQLVEFLDDDENALSHLLRQQSQLYVALVLVAVADDDGVALALYGDDGVKLRF